MEISRRTPPRPPENVRKRPSQKKIGRFAAGAPEAPPPTGPPRAGAPEGRSAVGAHQRARPSRPSPPRSWTRSWTRPPLATPSPSPSPSPSPLPFPSLSLSLSHHPTPFPDPPRHPRPPIKGVATEAREI